MSSDINEPNPRFHSITPSPLPKPLQTTPVLSLTHLHIDPHSLNTGKISCKSTRRSRFATRRTLINSTRPSRKAPYARCAVVAAFWRSQACFSLCYPHPASASNPHSAASPGQEIDGARKQRGVDTRQRAMVIIIRMRKCLELVMRVLPDALHAPKDRAPIITHAQRISRLSQRA